MVRVSLRERFAVSTDRSLNSYLNSSGLWPEDLYGKKILDLGAGAANLEKQLAARGINCEVVNVDLAYMSNRKSRFWNWIGKMRLEDFPGNAIRADMTSLPLLDKSVDITFASWSLSYWLPPSRTSDALKEAVRVTRGNIYIFPYDEITNLEYPEESRNWNMEHKQDEETLVISDQRKLLLA